MAKKKNEEAEVQETEAKPEKPKQPQQNGVTRPKEGTLTARVWEIADQISEEKGEPATRGEVMKVYVEEEGNNEATCATQFNRWRKFYGIAPQRKKKAAAEDETEVEEG